MSETATQPDTLLRVAGLTKSYRMGGRDLPVLRGVDVDVKRGEWLTILGASGSGKSTLLHLMGGLDRPDTGEIDFSGRAVSQFGRRGLNRYRSRDVGFVFQFYHLLPELTALENVMIAGCIAGSGSKRALRDRAAELLDRVGLSERTTHRPHKLSGGERQRVAIARALFNEPALLLADEPTGNLDSATGQRIMDVLEAVYSDGKTVVLVTHDPAIARHGDRQITLADGQLKR